MRFSSFHRRTRTVCALFLTASCVSALSGAKTTFASEKTASDFQTPVRLINSYPSELGTTEGPWPYGPYGTTSRELYEGMGAAYVQNDKYGPFEDLYCHYIGGDNGYDPAIPAYCVEFDVFLDGSADKTPSLTFDSLTSQQQYAITLALAFSPDLTIPGYSSSCAGDVPKDTYLSWLGVQQLIWNIAGSNENGYTPIGSSRTDESGNETNAADFPLLSGQALTNAELFSRETGSYDTEGIALSMYKSVAGKVMSAASFSAHTNALDGTSLSLKQSSGYKTDVFIGRNIDPDLLQISCQSEDIDCSYNPADGMLSVSIPLEKAADKQTTVTLSHLLPDKNDSAVYYTGGGQVVAAHSPKTALNSVSIHVAVEKPVPSVTPARIQIQKLSRSSSPLAGAVFQVTYEPAGESTLDSQGNPAEKRVWFLETGDSGTAGFDTLSPDYENSPLFPEADGGYLIPAGSLTVKEYIAPPGYEPESEETTLKSSGDGFTSPVVYPSDTVTFTDKAAVFRSYSTNASWYSSEATDLGNEVAYSDLASAISSGSLLSVADNVSWEGAAVGIAYQVHTELFEISSPDETVKAWDTSFSFPSASGSAQMIFPLSAEELSALKANDTWQLRQTLTLDGEQTAYDTSESEQIHITEPSLLKTTAEKNHSADESFQYCVTFTVPGDSAYTCLKAELTDSLPEGVSLIPGSAVLSEGAEALENSLYSVKEETGSSDSLILTLTDSALQKFSGHELILTYSAKIKESAVPAEDLINLVTYTSITPAFTRTLTSEVPVYTGFCTLKKMSDSGTPLSGARFQLLNADGTPYALHREEEPDGSAYTVMSGADGSFTFTGLADGDYLIQETQAAEGSSLLTSPFAIRIEDGALAEESPDTVINPGALTLHAGGPGSFTLLFISAALAAAALYIRRRRHIRAKNG